MLTLIGALLVGKSSAQSNPGPTAAVAAAFAAQDSADIPALVGLLDPDRMAAFKDRQLQQDSIFGELMARHPDPRAPRRTMLQAVFHVKDRAEFARLAPAEVLTRWFEQTMKGRSRVRMMWPGTGSSKREILGEVEESPDLVHVVFRETEPSPPAAIAVFEQEPRIRVISVRRTPAGWRVGLNGGLVVGEGGDWGIGYDVEEDDTASGH